MAVLRAPAAEQNLMHRHPALVLAACKPALGHTEPAAGAVGLVHALVALQHMQQQPLLHLSVVGPLPDEWC